MGVSKFLQIIKARADELAILGAPIDIEDFSEIILEGLGAEYKELARTVQLEILQSLLISSMKNF
jgi:lipoate-protein ligase A